MSSARMITSVLAGGGLFGLALGYGLYERGLDRAAAVYRLVETHCADWFAGRDATRGLVPVSGSAGHYLHRRSGLTLRFAKGRCKLSDAARPLKRAERERLIAPAEAALRALLPGGTYENHEADGQFAILRSIKSDANGPAFVLSQGDLPEEATNPVFAEIHLSQVWRDKPEEAK